MFIRFYKIDILNDIIFFFDVLIGLILDFNYVYFIFIFLYYVLYFRYGL